MLLIPRRANPKSKRSICKSKHLRLTVEALAKKRHKRRRDFYSTLLRFKSCTWSNYSQIYEANCSSKVTSNLCTREAVGEWCHGRLWCPTRGRRCLLAGSHNGHFSRWCFVGIESNFHHKKSIQISTCSMPKLQTWRVLIYGYGGFQTWLTILQCTQDISRQITK